MKECFQEQQCGAESIINTVKYATTIADIVKTKNYQKIAELLQPQMAACMPE